MTEAEPVIRAVIPDANVPVSVRSTGLPVIHRSIGTGGCLPAYPIPGGTRLPCRRTRTTAADVRRQARPAPADERRFTLWAKGRPHAGGVRPE